LALLAQRALLRTIRNGGQRFERDPWHANLRFAATTINDGSGGKHLYAGRLEQADYFLGAASGGNYILNHHGSFARPYREAAAKRHLICGRVTLSKKRCHTQSTRHLVPYDDASHGGRHHDIERAIANQRLQSRGKIPA
jgi:hypothetical protein